MENDEHNRQDTTWNSGIHIRLYHINDSAVLHISGNARCTHSMRVCSGVFGSGNHIRNMVDKETTDTEGEGEETMSSKLTSRKFWITVAAVLASLGTTVGGIISGNETLAIVASICTALSAAIYAGAEAYVDAKAVGVGKDE